MSNENQTVGIGAWLKLAFLALTWGSSFILMKRGLFDSSGNPLFQPIEVGGLRIAIAYISLLVPALRGLRTVRKEHIGPLLIVGFIGSGIPAILFSIVQTHLNSSTTGILNALTPLFTLLLGLVFFQVTVSKRSVIGIVLGLVGAISLVIARKGFDLRADMMYTGLVILACVCYALSVNTIKKYLTELKPVEVTGMAFFFMGPFALILLYFSKVKTVVLENPEGLNGLGYIALLAIVGTAIAIVIFNYLIKETSALFASSVTYLMPVVATIWGVLDGENFMLLQGVAALIVLYGVYLVNSQSKKRLEK